jgi:hypothetical protein
MRTLQDSAQADIGGLLRVLLVRHQQVSPDAAVGLVLRIIKLTQQFTTKSLYPDWSGMVSEQQPATALALLAWQGPST